MANELVKPNSSMYNDLPAVGGMDGDYNFPSDLMDPAIKQTKAYALKYVKCGYHNHYSNRCMITNDIRMEWFEKRTYADGNQSNAKYATRLSKLRNAQNQTISYNDLDQRLLKLLPKYLDIITSYLEKIDYDVYCDSIHPEAQTERDKLKWGLWVKAQTKDFFNEMEKRSGVPLADSNQEQLPKNMNELDLMMQYSVRLAEETKMELQQQAVLYENDFKENKKLWLRDAAVLGVMFRSCEIDRISGRIHFQYEDPCNAILEDFRGHKGKMQRRGVFRKMTVAQLILKAGNQFTREEYFDIAKNACGRWGNPTDIGNWQDYINTDATYNGTYLNWENNVLYVMDYEWDTCDRMKFERTNVYGNEMVYRRDFNTKLGKETVVGEDGLLYEKEVYATDIKTVYGCQWIVGTDYIFDYGKKANIPRPNENPKECYGKFDFYRIANTSILDRMLPYIDSMQLTWLKIQNLKARAIPKGFIIKMDALMNVVIDGKPKSQKELFEMLVQTGILVVNNKTTLDDASPNNSTKPIEETEGGMGQELAELTNSMIFDRNSLREDTGINEFFDASTPNSQALVGIKDAAIDGAQNAIYPLLSGFISFHESLCLSITLNAQLASRYMKQKGYVPSLGKFVEFDNSIDRQPFTDTPVMYGIRVQARATQAQKEQLLRYIDACLSNSQSPEGGGLEITDAVELSRLIANGTNLKLVVAIMSNRIAKHKERVQSEKQQLIEQQNNSVIQQTQVSNEEKRKTAIFENDIAKDFATHEANEKIRVLREEYALRMGQDLGKGEINKEIASMKQTKEPASR